MNYFELLLSRQKLGIFLENKVLQIFKFSKNFKNEKCAPNIIFFNEKKRETDLDNFRHRVLKVPYLKLGPLGNSIFTYTFNVLKKFCLEKFLKKQVFKKTCF